MKAKKLFFVFMIGVATVLSGCQRSASTAPNEVVTPTEISAIPTPTSNPAQILIAQTQTASALIQPTRAPTVTKVPATATAAPSETEAVSIVVTVTPAADGTPPATQPTIAIPTLARPVTYTLQDYEDPYCIARRYNLDIGEVLSLNDLTMESRPKAGTVLQIPATTHHWSSGARMLVQHPARYTVRKGDTIYAIACKYGDVSPEAIAAVNNLQEPYPLSTGQELSIP